MLQTSAVPISIQHAVCRRHTTNVDEKIYQKLEMAGIAPITSRISPKILWSLRPLVIHNPARFRDYRFQTFHIILLTSKSCWHANNTQDRWGQLYKNDRNCCGWVLDNGRSSEYIGIQFSLRSWCQKGHWKVIWPELLQWFLKVSSSSWARVYKLSSITHCVSKKKRHPYKAASLS